MLPTIAEAFHTLGLFSLTCEEIAKRVALAEALRFSMPPRLGASLSAQPNFTNAAPLYLANLLALIGVDAHAGVTSIMVKALGVFTEDHYSVPRVTPASTPMRR